jgi:hypothetical protein
LVFAPRLPLASDIFLFHQRPLHAIVHFHRTLSPLHWASCLITIHHLLSVIFATAPDHAPTPPFLHTHSIFTKEIMTSSLPSGTSSLQTGLESSNPEAHVELNNLATHPLQPSATETPASEPSTTQKPSTASADAATMPADVDASSANPTSPPAEPFSLTSEPPRPTPPSHLNRTETEAIGPSSDHPLVKSDADEGPVVVITLLRTTGERHPYKIDAKYLRKRGVEVEDMDPYNISVYTLKELILRDWRQGMRF